jgi:predicted pyridoxine 5'-phosphate oxidase superfamily flavin-nucleotide-binding protein
MPRHHERRRQSRRFARGDPPGFVQILDDETLLIPDRPGNNHLDSIENIIANPNVGLIFFVPGSEKPCA